MLRIFVIFAHLALWASLSFAHPKVAEVEELSQKIETELTKNGLSTLATQLGNEFISLGYACFGETHPLPASRDVQYRYLELLETSFIPHVFSSQSHQDDSKSLLSSKAFHLYKIPGPYHSSLTTEARVFLQRLRAAFIRMSYSLKEAEIQAKLAWAAHASFEEARSIYDSILTEDNHFETLIRAMELTWDQPRETVRYTSRMLYANVPLQHKELGAVCKFLAACRSYETEINPIQKSAYLNLARISYSTAKEAAIVLDQKQSSAWLKRIQSTFMAKEENDFDIEPKRSSSSLLELEGKDAPKPEQVLSQESHSISEDVASLSKSSSSFDTTQEETSRPSSEALPLGGTKQSETLELLDPVEQEQPAISYTKRRVKIAPNTFKTAPRTQKARRQNWKSGGKVGSPEIQTSGQPQSERISNSKKIEEKREDQKLPTQFEVSQVTSPSSKLVIKSNGKVEKTEKQVARPKVEVDPKSVLEKLNLFLSDLVVHPEKQIEADEYINETRWALQTLKGLPKKKKSEWKLEADLCKAASKISTVKLQQKEWLDRALTIAKMLRDPTLEASVTIALRSLVDSSQKVLGMETGAVQYSFVPMTTPRSAVPTRTRAFDGGAGALKSFQKKTSDGEQLGFQELLELDRLLKDLNPTLKDSSDQFITRLAMKLSSAAKKVEMPPFYRHLFRLTSLIARLQVRSDVALLREAFEERELLLQELNSVASKGAGEQEESFRKFQDLSNQANLVLAERVFFAMVEWNDLAGANSIAIEIDEAIRKGHIFDTSEIEAAIKKFPVGKVMTPKIVVLTERQMRIDFVAALDGGMSLLELEKFVEGNMKKFLFSKGTSKYLLLRSTLLLKILLHQRDQNLQDPDEFWTVRLREKVSSSVTELRSLGKNDKADFLQTTFDRVFAENVQK